MVRHILSITHKQFTEFLSAVAPEKPCPECGHNDWSTSSEAGVNEPSEDNHLQVAAIIAADDRDSYMPAHSLHCNHCGYIKFYNATVVNNWILANGR